MKVLELFSGTASFSKVARARGHETFTVDFKKSFQPDLVADVMDLSIDMIPFKPDIIWASPPCERFSTGSMSRSWRGIWHIRNQTYQPMDLRTGTAIALVIKTLQLIDQFKPRFWVIENPRGVLRKLSFMPNEFRKTVCYCRYGDKRMKPTDLWTNIPGFKPIMCHNGNPDHEEARRGAKTGTQGLKGAKERGIVPPDLCSKLIELCENGRSRNLKEVND